MRKIINIIRWIGVFVSGTMVFTLLTQGTYLGALFFFLTGAIIAPLDIIYKIRSRLKLNKIVSIILAVIFWCAGVLTISTVDVQTDADVETEMPGTIANDITSNNNSYNDIVENTSDEEITSEPETTTEKPTTAAVTTTESITEENTTKAVETTKKDVTTTQKSDNSKTVYITPTGSRYHYNSNCGNGTYSPTTLTKAKNMGLTACKKCAGG